MFRKLDRLVFRSFIGPFVATFFITLLVLVMQFFWLYIDEFVGKGLDTQLILEFIWYQSAVLVPLALPLSILLSSIMTFGKLGESFELVAIRSAGISLLRFMRPLFLFTLLICGVAFLFSNYIIPVANLKSRTLLADIVYAKPAFDLKEGVFYDKINGFAIKIGKKESDSIIRDVIIFEQNNPLQDNFLIARSGTMTVTPDKRFLEFNLRDGWRYQERGNNEGNSEFIRIGFREYRKQFDLSSFQFNRTADSVNRNNDKMLSMRQLETIIDSLKIENRRSIPQMEQEIYRTLGFLNYLDTTAAASANAFPLSEKERLLMDSLRSDIDVKARGVVATLRVGLESFEMNKKEKLRNLGRFQIEWNRKIALSLACLVLFLIGAPLGSIIRKGGIGTPLILAIVFFMVFYFSTTAGEKLAKARTLTPFEGMFLSTFILLPVGIFLTIKAMNDSQLLSREFYYRLMRRVRRIRTGKNPPDSPLSARNG
ncbi:MAG TPA: LptF/LptG family permease [Chitinophagaceae bacterium]|nr:LptF/LptG family permease [Chitinophagaceae bacterium]